MLCRSPDKDNTEHQVVNPIYNDSLHGSGEFGTKQLSVAENPQYGTRADITYELINDLPTQPRGAQLHDK